jgi:site-specific DNA-cytosine methylase
MEQKTILVLFKGLGGFESAFITDSNYCIITVDIEPAFEPTLVWDISKHESLIRAIEAMDLPNDGRIDIILASPPCVEFYKVAAPWFEDYYGKVPSMDLVKSTMAIIDHFKPPIYIIENTKHGKKWICEEIGDIRHKIGPYYLWGEFKKFNAIVKPKGVWDSLSSADPLRSALRAKLPLTFSQALKDTLENQRSILDFIDLG